MILILEDTPDIYEMYEMQAFTQHLLVILAHDVPHAAASFAEHRDEIQAIVFDGKINGQVQPTCDLVSQIKASGFRGPMVAASLHPDTNDYLIAAGCDHKVRDKHSAIETVATLLTKGAANE